MDLEVYHKFLKILMENNPLKDFEAESPQSLDLK